MRFFFSLLLAIFSSYILVPIVPEMRDIVHVTYESIVDQCHTGVYCEKKATGSEIVCFSNPTALTESTGRSIGSLTDGFSPASHTGRSCSEQTDNKHYNRITPLSYDFFEPFGREYVGTIKIQV